MTPQEFSRVSLEERNEPLRLSVEARVDVEKALQALSEDGRKLMLLHVATGLTSKEMAAQVTLSTVCVRVRLHRAKLQPRKRFTARAEGSRSPRHAHRRRVSSWRSH